MFDPQFILVVYATQSPKLLHRVQLGCTYADFGLDMQKTNGSLCLLGPGKFLRRAPAAPSPRHAWPCGPMARRPLTPTHVLRSVRSHSFVEQLRWSGMT